MPSSAESAAVLRPETEEAEPGEGEGVPAVGCCCSPAPVPKLGDGGAEAEDL